MKSPLHEKFCVAGSSILVGAIGAVGTGGSTPGLLVGAAVGFIAGRYICGNEAVSGYFKDKMDFRFKIDLVIASPENQKKVVAALVASGIVDTEDSGAALLRYVIQEVRSNPKKYFDAWKQNNRGPAAGSTQHGLAILGNKSNAAARTARAQG